MGVNGAVTRLVTAHVWRVVRRERKRRLFVADEAATLLEHPERARFIGNVARRCRKHYEVAAIEAAARAGTAVDGAVGAPGAAGAGDCAARPPGQRPRLDG